MSEKVNPKIPKLKKDGTVDKRGETSKKNLDKGKSIIKQALEKIKEEKKVEIKSVVHTNFSSDEYSTEEEEIELPQLERKITTDNRSFMDEGSTFTFEKKLEESIQKINNEYTQKLSMIENENKLTKAELNAIKEQNQALKKSMASSFRTHAENMNKEMYLKF